MSGHGQFVRPSFRVSPLLRKEGRGEVELFSCHHGLGCSQARGRLTTLPHLASPYKGEERENADSQVNDLR